ncbi:hypothetical protein [Amycolatopsis magusensis]|uniref:hypothetical protein n=1 Tax=Amycolatopsis magusensis TaxID=882444 RepID=UPI0037A2FA21
MEETMRSRRDGPDRWDFGSPVRVNGGGPEEEWLLRPGLSVREFRWAAIWDDLRDDLVLVLIGGTGVGAGTFLGAGFFGWTLGVLGLLAIVGALVDASMCVLQRDSRTPELGRSPGRYFYCFGHFSALPTSKQVQALGIIRAVEAIHAGPAAAWIGPRTLNELHVAAWEALRRLESVQRQQAPAVVEMVARETAVALTEFQNCAVLVAAWNSKLQQQSINVGDLTEAVFARVTAARDVYGGGPFPWEKN